MYSLFDISQLKACQVITWLSLPAFLRTEWLDNGQGNVKTSAGRAKLIN
jgi:hypothetical protein